MRLKQLPTAAFNNANAIAIKLVRQVYFEDSASGRVKEQGYSVLDDEVELLAAQVLIEIGLGG